LGGLNINMGWMTELLKREDDMDELFDAIIQAAEKTAAQASGNDQDDWNNFAKALRVEREQLEEDIEDRPKPTPHDDE
jgi:hypothetical protein